MMFLCPECEFDIASFPATVDVRVPPGNDAPAVVVYCPVCGVRATSDVAEFGVFYSRERSTFSRWQSPGSRGDRRVMQVGSEPGTGLMLRFEVLESIRPEAICYAAVPVFKQQDGSMRVPDLPVKREFFEFVDLKRWESEGSAELRRGRVVCRIPLKGQHAPAEVELRVMPPVAGGAAGEHEQYRLAVWPKLRVAGWKRHFVYFGQPGGAVRAAAEQARVAVLCDGVWQEGKPSGDGLESVVAAVDGDPEWVHVAWGDGTGRETGGGAFRRTPGEAAVAHGSSVDVAVDFGTSNTFVAYLGRDATGGLVPKPLPFLDLDDVIVDGADQPVMLTRPWLWFPRAGFSYERSFLPSEIQARSSRQGVFADVDRITNWEPLVDYTIPSAGVTVQFDEGKHNLGGLKWTAANPDVSRTAMRELQRRYLEFLLLFTAAQVTSADEHVRQIVNVHFSYPLVMGSDSREGEKEELRQALVSACARVAEWTGLDLAPTLEVDEARAAGASAGSPTEHEELSVDIGGGTTDIALRTGPRFRPDGAAEAYHVVTSVRYAGGTYLRSLVSKTTSCLGQRVTHDGLQRAIREVDAVSEVFDRGEFIQPRMKRATQNKALLFFDYLNEYVARIVAARLVSGDAAQRYELGESGVFKVKLYLLGNGWGFAALFAPGGYGKRAAAGLTRRANELLKQSVEEGGQPYPKVEVVWEPLRKVPHPKTAVAYGLLELAQRNATPGAAPSSGRDAQSRSIMGLTIDAGGRGLSWALPVRDDGWCPDGQEPLSNGTRINEVHDGDPSFPSRLTAPTVLDEGLQRTWDVLQNHCLGVGMEWVVRSPYEVLLEELIADELRTMA